MLPKDPRQGAHIPSVLLKLRQLIEILEPVVDEIAFAVKLSRTRFCRALPRIALCLLALWAKLQGIYLFPPKKFKTNFNTLK